METVEPVYPVEYNVACYFVEPNGDFDLDFILDTWPNTPDTLANKTFINRENTKIEYKEIGPIDPPRQLEGDFDEIYFLIWERWKGWTEMLVVGTISDSRLHHLRQKALDSDIEDYLPSATVKHKFREFVNVRIPHNLRATITRTETLSEPAVGPFPREEVEKNVAKVADKVDKPENPEEEDDVKQEIEKVFANESNIDLTGPLAAYIIWMWRKQISLAHLRTPITDYSAILGRKSG